MGVSDITIVIFYLWIHFSLCECVLQQWIFIEIDAHQIVIFKPSTRIWWWLILQSVNRRFVDLIGLERYFPSIDSLDLTLNQYQFYTSPITETIRQSNPIPCQIRKFFWNTCSYRLKLLALKLPKPVFNSCHKLG